MIVVNISSLSRFVMRIILLAILTPLCLSACLDGPATNTVAVTESSAKPLLQNNVQPNIDLKTISIDDIKIAKEALNTLITDTQCDTNAQCKVSPIGHRACGGPSAFIVYSTKTTEQKEVTALSEKVTTLESKYNTKEGLISTCQFLIAPSAQCIDNKCVRVEKSAVSTF